MAGGSAILFKEAEVAAGGGLLAFVSAAGGAVAEGDTEEVAECAPEGGAEVGRKMGGFHGFERQPSIAPGKGFEPIGEIV